MYLVLFIIFILGLIIGSFLNVLIWRLNDEKAPKFWQGRSMCPRCGHQLAWFDNIPLLSFLMLGGKCRFCKKAISWQYPLVELTTAVAFVLVWTFTPGQLDILVKLDLLVITATLVVIFVSDWIYGLIPDEMVVVGSGAAIFQIGLISPIGQIWQNVMVGLLSTLGFFLIVLATKFRGMGLGDVKFAFFMGLFLGWPKILVALWSAFILGGIVAVILLLLKRTKLSATIALGPFLVLGVVIAALWSRQILSLIGL